MLAMELLLFAVSVAWNAFLAVIPVALAYTIVRIFQMPRTKAFRLAAIAPLFVVWLAFLPNTCYLLTEWRHFLGFVDYNDLYVRSRTDGVLTIELCALGLFYFLYSTFGMVTFALALRPMENLAIDRGAATRFWAIPFFAVVSLGMYLGLILRFNSWQLITSPGEIWGAVVQLGGRPLLSTFIVAFGLFLWISYRAIDIWIEGVAARYGHISRRCEPVAVGTAQRP